MQKNYTDCINILQTQWQAFDLNERFAMGDQDIWAQLFPGVSTFKRKMFNFNLINSTIQMIGGYQRRNRKSSICIPVHPMMQKTADQLTKCLFHVHKSGTYQVYSDAFEQGACINGLGWVSIFPDYSSDPISPEIRLRYLDAKATLYDPFFRRPDASDMRYFWTRQFFDRQEAAILYPQHADSILALPKGTYKDDKFYYMPEVYQIQFPNLIAFDEYWYLTSREATYLVDKETEECQEFSGDEEDLRDIMRSFKNKLAVIKKQKPTVRRTISLNDRVLIDEANPYKLDRYPYVPALAYFTPNTPYYQYKFRSVVSDLKDCQYLFNRRKVADLDILESQQQGLKIKKGALVTSDDSLNQGNGRVLTIDPAYQMSDVEPMQIIPPAPTMIQMEEMLKSTMSMISGVNETMLGTDISDKAGIISMMRQSAGITTLTRLFDQCDEMQRQCGDVIIEMIQKLWTYGKVRQVIGEDPTAEFDNKLFFKYGCKTIQGALTETQQQLGLQQLLYFRETTGIPIPSKMIIEASTLQNKDELIQHIMAEEEGQKKQADELHQIQMQQLQVETETKLAYARSQDGLSKERIAKIQTDKAVAYDKIRKSHQEDTHSLLNLVKAVKELKGMDIDHLARQVEILNNLQAATEPQGQEQQQEAI